MGTYSEVTLLDHMITVAFLKHLPTFRKLGKYGQEIEIEINNYILICHPERTMIDILLHAIFLWIFLNLVEAKDCIFT